MRQLTLWPKKSLSQDLWKDFSDIFEEMNRGFSYPTERTRDGVTFAPALDVKETESEYEVHFDIPGVNKEELKIEVRDNALFVTGERKREEKHEGDFVRYERVFGRFERSIQLPKDIESEGVSATYDHGVLTVTVPKAKSSKARVITVK